MLKLITCKQVSTALGEKDYERMTSWERLKVRAHVALCVICGKYNRQVMDTHDLMRRFRRREDEGMDLPGVELAPGDAAEIKAALRAVDPRG